MTAVGGLIGGTDPSNLLRSALLSAVHRGGEATVVTKGRTAIGAMGPGADTCTGADGSWAVALAGTVDSIGGADIDHPVAGLLDALNRTGLSVLSTLSGEFAGVASDGERLIGFRDHLGSTPLFSGSTGSRAVVATEPKQVVAGLGRSRRPDIDGLVGVYFSQWEPPDDVPSVVEGVDRIPRRSVMEVTPTNTRRLGWTWDPTGLLETSRLGLSDAIDTGWQIVETAVERALAPTGAVSLSGGIDSTLIAAAGASRYQANYGKPLTVVTAAYPHAPSVDESSFVTMTGKYLDLNVISFDSSRGRLADLETWIDRFDGPTHGLAIGPMAELNEMAAAHGVTQLLGGELAELVYDLREFSLSRILWRGNLRVAGRHLQHLHRGGIPAMPLVRMIANGLVPSRPALAYQRRFRPPPDMPAWLDSSSMPGIGNHWALEQPARWRWGRIQEFFATGPTYPGLELASIMGDFAGVATRRPLASREVWEFFLSLPPEIKFPDGWTKSLVRRMLSGRAPDEVVWRTDKTVFDADAQHRAGYEDLRRWLTDSFRLPGVNYPELHDRLEREDLTTWELSMARTLASIHVFVGLCS